MPDYDVAKIADREDLGGRWHVHLGTMRLVSEEVARQSEAMYEAADELTKYVSDKRTPFGEA